MQNASSKHNGDRSSTAHRRPNLEERRRNAAIQRAQQVLNSHGLAEAVVILVTEQADAANAPPGMIRAKDAGVTPRVWRNLIKRGKLTGHRVGRELLVRRDEFDRYLRSVETSCPSSPSGGDDIEAFAERCRG